MWPWEDHLTSLGFNVLIQNVKFATNDLDGAFLFSHSLPITVNEARKSCSSGLLGAYHLSSLLCHSFKSGWPSLFLLPLPDQFLGLCLWKWYNPKALGFQIALGKLELDKYFIVKPRIAMWLLPHIKQIQNFSTVGSGGKRISQQLKTYVDVAVLPSSYIKGTGSQSGFKDDLPISTLWSR